MIFTTQCPSCEATFPIDSAKVPDGGVYARCSQCEGVFLVEVPADESQPTPTPTPVAPEAAEVHVAPPSPQAFDVEPEPALDVKPEPLPEVEPAIEPAAEVEVTPAETAAPAPPSFGKRDPSERAQRLARVLVSDMIAYHPDRHRRSLEEGTLKPDFEEEIEKSWNEYVDQVGKELAEGTTYFTDALNEILAKGTVVF